MILSTYFQSDEFTCGPAALLTAMRSLKSDIDFSQEEEFLIWHEANSIFMGVGHPGCGIYGLALSAIKRGFKCIVHLELNGDSFLFSDTVHNELQKKIYAWNETRFRELFLKIGGEERSTCIKYEDIKNNIDHGFASIILTADLKYRNDGHWVTIDRVANEKIRYFDPYLEKDTCKFSHDSVSGLYTVSKNDFLDMICYGNRKKKACLYLIS